MGKLVTYKSNPETDKSYSEATKKKRGRDSRLPEQNKIKAEAKDKPGDKEVSNLDVACVHLVNYMRGW